MEILDRMEVSGITTWAYHGVFDHERRDGQQFAVDLTWWSDMSQAAKHDDLSTTADYGEVSTSVVELLQGAPVDLIETLAYDILERLFDRFGFEYARIALHKPDAPLTVEFDDVVLTLTMAQGGNHNRGQSMDPATRCFARAQEDGEGGPQDDAEGSRTCVFSLGSNIEPRLEYLQFGVTALASTPGIDNPRVSSVLETTAQSVVEQSDFLNVALMAETPLPALDLLHRTQAIEEMCGRIREIAHGPRTLDIDLIAVGDEVWTHEDLTIPHPLARTRGFVLIPYLELDPQAKLGEESVKDLVKGLSDQGVRRSPSTLFCPPIPRIS
jgi:dihydroneopterin aldolase/2-amino-4-hydroxy-6-hydroxymethyldihydropteridine diphosphokinase